MMDVQQVEARLANLTAEHRGVAATVDELSRRRADAGRQTEEQRDKLARAQRQAAKMLSRVGGENAPLGKEADLAEVRGGSGEIRKISPRCTCGRGRGVNGRIRPRVGLGMSPCSSLSRPHR